MKEKEKLIMEAAMKLFAQKGFSMTSIQEIANEAGISKGSFYLYYKSKEALLIAIFIYFSQKLTESISINNQHPLSPRELLIEKMITRFQFFLTHKEFIIMYARESTIPANKEIHQIIHKTHQSLLHALQDDLISIYGNDVKPYVLSLALLIEGIYDSHLKILLFSRSTIDSKEHAHYLLRRIDNLAFGLIQSGEQPFITRETFLYPSPCGDLLDNLSKNDLLNLIASAMLHWKHDDHIYITLEVLEEEISRNNPRIPIIKGMLENLKKEDELLHLQQAIIQLFH